MDTDTLIPWRKSDSRLVGQAFTTLGIIAILGLIIAGLYFVTPPETQVLGTNTTSSGK